MVKHMIIWKLKEDLSEPRARAAEIKRALEDLNGKIDGLIKMQIITEGLPSSAGDLMMDSLFESNEALCAYQEHPAHRKIAEGLVRPAVCQRLSFDYTLS